MNEEQKAVEVKKSCPATIQFGDDFGDNYATFYCSLEAGHEGEHEESGDMADVEEPLTRPYRLTWQDEHPSPGGEVSAYPTPFLHLIFSPLRRSR